jgi:hypothetical protein
MQLTKSQKVFLNKAVYRGDWTLNSNGKIDVDGGVRMVGVNLTEIPVKFNKVSGSFMCSFNHLTSLEFAPTSVGEDFYCSNNLLTSLEFAPSKVGGIFNCSNNHLKNYFKNIKEEEFNLWDKLGWGVIISEYPFLITIAKNYVGEETFIKLVENYPKTKLYLR